MEQRNTQTAGGGEDAMLSFLLILAIAAGAFWFLWHRYHPEIASYVIASQEWEMGVISHFTDRYALLQQQTAGLDATTLPFKILYKLCHMVGLFFRIPAGLVIGCLAVLCLVCNPASRFTKNYTTDTLAKAQSRVFPTIAAFAARRLRPVGVADAAPRPLDPALHTLEWIDRFARTERGAFDEDGARRELTRQLGPVWAGPTKALPVARCLLAAFVLHAARDRDGAQAFLGDWSDAMARPEKEGPEGPLQPLAVPAAITEAADATLADPQFEPFLAPASNHAFTATALMSVLSHARKRAGVLAPAQFNVMKLSDRRLWYALHSLGFPEEEGAEPAAMPNPRVEAVAARDHWAAEILETKPLPVPSIERAVAVIRQVAQKQRKT